MIQTRRAEITVILVAVSLLFSTNKPEGRRGCCLYYCYEGKLVIKMMVNGIIRPLESPCQGGSIGRLIIKKIVINVA